jgi:acetolactate synthase I/II/III large subunit
VAWGQGVAITTPLPILAPRMPSREAIDRAAAMLRSGFPTAMLLSGKALYGYGLAEAGRIAAATGAKLLSPYPFTRFQRGAGIPAVDRIAYILEQAKDQLKEFRQFILVGASAPVAYFAYPGRDAVMTPNDSGLHTLARPEEDLVGALSALADALSIQPGIQAAHIELEKTALPAGEITLPGVSSVIGALIPENAILVEESMTSGRGLMPATRNSPPHDWLGNTGGSIGIALPLAVGAAVAAPDRRVLCLTADGSAMYTLQALGTMARERLKVTTVVFANRTYAVLKREFSYLGVGEPGPKAKEMFEIGRPDLDWVQLAKGMGVPACRVTSLEALGNALRDGFVGEGPTLIEIPL